ncbi:MAG: hypothetical protein FWH37_01125 [Candidatus Bathyarchaeota archaeon]|nr:hypothetical protein [Candidatus Termiticorpusculum sp.]
MKKQKQNNTQNTGTLENLFGGVTAKILDFLSVFRDWDYSKQDIAKNSNVSLRHAIMAIDKLEEKGILKHTRNVGNSQMYKFNTSNETAMLLQKFTLSLAFDDGVKIVAQEEEHEKQEIIKHNVPSDKL